MFKSFLHVWIGMILISPLQSIKTEEIPPDLVYPSPGCGTGCSITQISKTYPEKLDNVWIRVKVEMNLSFHKSSPFFLWWRERRRRIFFSRTGIWNPRVSEGWFFANCSEGLYGSDGSKKDISDSRIRSIYLIDDSGDKYFNSSHAGGFTYSNWKKLCDSEFFKTWIHSSFE